MRNYKLIFITTMILAMVIGLSGCMKSGKPEKEEMMEFMKNKYNEEFEFVSIGNEAWNANYTEMIVHSEKFPKGRIVVRKSGDKIVDNYTDFLMKEKIEEEISSIVSQVYSESKVFYLPGGMPMGDEVNLNMNAQEYSRARALAPLVTICISDNDYKSNKEQKIEELRRKLAEEQFLCRLDVYYIEKNKLQLINHSNINELYDLTTMSKWAIAKGYFKMNDSYQFISSDWSELNE